MQADPSSGISELLAAWGRGDRTALDRLAPLVDAELRRVARRYLGKRPADINLQTTAIINETYLHLLQAGAIRCPDRARFYGLCAQVMRRILVDFARMRAAGKRGAGAEHVPVDQTDVAS